MVLVVGATGHLGSYLVQRCSLLGIRAKALVRPETLNNVSSLECIDWAVGDLRARESIWKQIFAYTDDQIKLLINISTLFRRNSFIVN